MAGLVSHLIVDAAAFIRNVLLHEIGERIYTLKEVVDEIKDKQTKERLQVLPYELIFRSPSTESIKAVTDFSKKTGDYFSLSATDIKVLAITYQLHKENVGLDSIRTEPQRIISSSQTKEDASRLPGFYSPSSEWENVKEDNEGSEITEHSEKLTSNNEDCNEEDFGSDEGEDDGDEGWVTPDNLQDAIKDLGLLTIKENPVLVGCITSDFAMQNVLLQMGLNVLAVDGKLIKQARTYILRCYACFKTTTKVDVRFCPRCGNATLKKVQVNVNEDGSVSLKINYRRPINIRGKRFSLPMPKGGKHSTDPILCPDQPVAQNRPSKKSLQKTDALNPDYAADVSPFALNDIYSRSAQLRVNKCGRTFKGNPNKVRGPGKTRK